MRLIDADALREQIERCYCDPCEAEKRDYNHVRCRACEAGDTLDWIDDAPTIDPESLIPHGRWIEGKEIEEGTEIPMGVCSICGDSYNLEEFPFATLCDYFIYCPNCGAKMDKA